MKKRVVYMVLIMAVLLTVMVGCSLGNKQEQEIGELEYEVIDVKTLDNEDIIQWYGENFKEEGIATYDGEENKYILLSSGERPTGGYTLEITSVDGTEDEIIVEGLLEKPGEGEMVTTALTYPNKLIKIKKDNRPVVLGEMKERLREANQDNEGIVKQGNYVGLIDSNSAEIKVQGEAMAFRLSEDVKSKLSTEQPATGMDITITYYENENNQFVLTDITWDKETITGIYVGQIDSNSIEIKVKGEANAYRLTEETRPLIATLSNGDQVTLSFHENEYNQLILDSIEKMEE